MPSLKTSIKIERRESEKILSRGIWGPALREWRDVVEDYIYVSRKRFDNKLSMFKLQLEVLQDILECENSVRVVKDVLKNPENIKNYNPDLEHLTENDKEAFERQLYQEIILIKALKEITDGHVWRMFNHNRPLLFNLGKEPSSGNLKIDTGFLAELHGWGKSILNSNVSHFVLNDITNFARIGDVIERNHNGLIEVSEIKSSKSQRGKDRKERLERQRDKRAIFESLANSGETIIAGKRIVILESTIPYTNSLKALEEGIIDSERSGIFAKRIAPYLTVVGVDQEVSSEKHFSKDYLSEYMDRNVKSSFQEGDPMVSLNSLDRINHAPSMTPLTIYPFSEKVVADLLLGKKYLLYYFNPGEFSRTIEKNNWTVTSSIFDQPLTDSSTPEMFCCRIKQGNLNIGIPWSLMTQIIFDTLDLSKVLDLFNFIYQNRILENDAFFIKFKNEEDVWN